MPFRDESGDTISVAENKYHWEIARLIHTRVIK